MYDITQTLVLVNLFQRYCWLISKLFYFLNVRYLWNLKFWEIFFFTGIYSNKNLKREKRKKIGEKHKCLISATVVSISILSIFSILKAVIETITKKKENSTALNVPSLVDIRSLPQFLDLHGALRIFDLFCTQTVPKLRVLF